MRILILNNGHGPIWSISTQARPTTKHESNLATYCYFHITVVLPVCFKLSDACLINRNGLDMLAEFNPLFLFNDDHGTCDPAEFGNAKGADI